MRVKLSCPLSAGEIKHAVKAKGNIADGQRFFYITTDSREALEGDLFISLAKDAAVSELYMLEARQRGATTLGNSQSVDLFVEDTGGALLDLAEYYKRFLTKIKKTVAITGSVGKTTTKEFLSHILSREYKVFANKGNMNNEIGLPLTILSAAAETEILILECGTNHEGEISRLSRCARPDIAIITNIGTAHIGNFNSRSEIAREKLSITDGMRDVCLLVPEGEPLLSGKGNLKTVSISSSKGDFRLIPKYCNTDAQRFDFCSSLATVTNATFPFDTEHLLSPLAFSIAAAQLIGADEKNIKKQIASIPPSVLRHKITEYKNYTIIDDSYNASLESVSAMLCYLSQYSPRPLAAVLGDIMELGAHSATFHRELGKDIYKNKINQVFLYGEQIKYTKDALIALGFDKDKIFIYGYETEIQSLGIIISQKIIKGSVLLIKGSHRTGLHRLSSYLRGE